MSEKNRPFAVKFYQNADYNRRRHNHNKPHDAAHQVKDSFYHAVLPLRQIVPHFQKNNSFVKEALNIHGRNRRAHKVRHKRHASHQRLNTIYQINLLNGRKPRRGYYHRANPRGFYNPLNIAKAAQNLKPFSKRDRHGMVVNKTYYLIPQSETAVKMQEGGKAYEIEKMLSSTKSGGFSFDILLQKMYVQCAKMPYLSRYFFIP